MLAPAPQPLDVGRIRPSVPKVVQEKVATSDEDCFDFDV